MVVVQWGFYVLWANIDTGKPCYFCSHYNNSVRSSSETKPDKYTWADETFMYLEYMSMMPPCCLTPASPDRARWLVPALCMLTQSDPQNEMASCLLLFQNLQQSNLQGWFRLQRGICAILTHSHWSIDIPECLSDCCFLWDVPCLALAVSLRDIYNFRLEFQLFRQLKVVT